MKLTTTQRDRYARNMALAGIGEEGQRKLWESKVLLIGAGGLGSPIALYLAAAGVGTLGIVDGDVVDVSNLQRQILHSEQAVGTEKALSAQRRLQELNGGVTVVPYCEEATRSNIADIINDKDYDFIIDGTDNFSAKFLINDACVLLQKPFSHAGVVAYHGQVLTYVPGQGPCYRCIFEEEPAPGDVPTAKDVGILGVAAGTIGTIQATEAIKYITGVGELLTGTLLTYDALTMTFRKVPFPQNPDCAVCGDHPTITAL